MYGAEYGMNLWLLCERRLPSTVASRTSQGRPMDNHVQRKRCSLITSYCYIIIFFVEMLALCIPEGTNSQVLSPASTGNPDVSHWMTEFCSIVDNVGWGSEFRLSLNFKLTTIMKLWLLGISHHVSKSVCFNALDQAEYLMYLNGKILAVLQ
jgi:hypothetical protein